MTPEERARFEEIERRLAWLEAKVGHAPEVAKPLPQPIVQPVAPPFLVKPAKMPPPAPLPEEERGNLETAFGLTWLSRIAVLTIVLALAFFFKYAFENHWISEWGRVLLGVGAGAIALGFGERFWRTGQQSFGQALTAAGIAFLYLSCWAAFGLYSLISQPVAFGLMLLTTAAAGALALRYNGAAVAMLGLAGGFLTPLLLGDSKDPWFVFGYALVLDGGAAFLARKRRWRWTEVLAVIGTMVLYLNQMPVPAESRLLFTLFVVAWYALFAASNFLPVFLIVQLLSGLALVEIWTPDTGILLLAVILAEAGLVVADRRGWSTAVTAAFTGFWIAYGASYAQASHPPLAGMLALLTAAYVMFLGWPVWRVYQRKQALRFQDLSLVALNAAFYFGACYALLETGYGAFEGLFAVAVAVVQMMVARILWQRDARGSLLAAGAAWVLLVLAAPIQFAGYRITIAWALEGAALVWIGTQLRNARAVNAALAVFGLVAVRLLILDSTMYADPASYDLLVNARFLVFAVSAASLWAAAWWIGESRRALVVYLGGHIAMLGGLCLEAAGWAVRSAAPENVRSVASMSISVLVAAYAVLLVAGGVATRHAVTRLAGVALIALVIVKLYLYDVWLLGQFYRMAAFAILGVLLLAMSYLYSRFRGSIENLWRP